jgi:two-component system, NtrC family, sensor kinase
MESCSSDAMNPLRSLQGRFTLYLALLIVVIMSGLSYWTISNQKALLERAIEREGMALAESLAISCTDTMLYEEIGLVDEGGLLDSYMSELTQKKNLDIRYAFILDATGKVLAHNLLSELGNQHADTATSRALASWETLLQYPSPAMLDISVPLAISTKRWGTLRIGIALEKLKIQIYGLIWRHILYTAGFILLMITVVTLLFGFITKPLKILSREMDVTTTGGDFTSIPALRQDEIGILQDSFYRMLQRIKENEKERERIQKSLLLTDKMVAIGKLTAGMAHEINNPLGGLLNCIYHFKRGKQTLEKQQEYLDLMEDGIKRIQNTVTNLLEFARNAHLVRVRTDIDTLLERTILLLDYQFRKNQIKIDKTIANDFPSIHVDRNQMEQVLINILLNALQAMPEGGVLRIKAAVVKEHACVTVSDTGKGIAEELLPKIFDPFFTTKGEGAGTGLGLWISQGIVERHHGTIQISSREGTGTTVEIQLPLT